MVKLTPDSAFVESVQSATRQPSHNQACVRGNPSVQTTSICAVDAPHPEKADPEAQNAHAGKGPVQRTCRVEDEKA
jgi:hypothetical protein